MVHGIEPHVSVESAWDSFSLCPSPAHTHALSLKINKLKKMVKTASLTLYVIYHSEKPGKEATWF